jgi:predicted RNA-binding protein YlxR (DUF448 family)
MKPNDRRCVSCRRIAPKGEFWRVVRDHSSRQVQLDQGMGRSAYLCRSEDCLAIARRKKKLSRALKTPIPGQLYDELERRLSQLDELGHEREC